MKKIFTITIFLAFLLIGFSLSAQRNCATMEQLEQQLQQDPGMLKNMERIEKMTQEYIRSGAKEKAVSGVVTIPVVVHVVYNNAAENISDAQIQSQIDVLNEDFRRLNADASNTPSDFTGVAADTEIEFCLASVDPLGNSTNGITRTFTTRTSFSSNNDMKFDANGGKDAWPAANYLNIWVCDLGNSLLGYAQFPGGSAATDGVVCNYPAFGRGAQYSLFTNFALGRTTTHEVGHWLNLRHIWGDGPCSFDDFVADTPEASGPNYSGTPCTYPGPNSCRPRGQAGKNDLPDMFQNYMDYSDDVCMNLFTLGQTDRMRALFDTGGARESLLSSSGCGNGDPVELCNDGLDNDGDGLVDCDDPDCDTDPFCQPVEPEICDDGIDNDGDGLIDCDDPDCGSAPNCQPTGTCAAPGGLTTEVRKGGKEALLSWNAVSGAVNYTVTLVNLSNGDELSADIDGTSAVASGLSKNANYEWCVVTNCSGESSEASCTSFTAVPGGRTTQLNATPLRIYPNPARDLFTIRINSLSSSLPVLSLSDEVSTESEYVVWMMDAYGRIVQKLQVPAGETTLEMHTRDLSSGLYLIKITDHEGNLESSGKVIINR
ncbi:M43 family zinc metalloprotease [Flavilitoribacter nigricans]|uniref:T9SS type A sorting domain-containing protein n=1 Tax=Flavilitoribacter nigricans (strain ATCC 23147 / DSM 23189 / NBRC 102662 / NCIMB 1420 / SS-2) TaxID=1122177 RepID=A0A2D0NKX0_FLAN2|nr:M43 family zinc metalloprotease [Flavilitoribacter nigricans]PHN08383.1 hypothetical protein CRP01_00280 [Flavilitoribacter nigricans DSM 23189 = NBRC 102662]